MRGLLGALAVLSFASALQAQGVRQLDQFDQALEEVAARRYEPDREFRPVIRLVSK